jgi:hypothetical protein
VFSRDSRRVAYAADRGKKQVVVVDGVQTQAAMRVFWRKSQFELTSTVFPLCFLHPLGKQASMVAPYIAGQQFRVQRDCQKLRCQGEWNHTL